jgi:hypothetical protein
MQRIQQRHHGVHAIGHFRLRLIGHDRRRLGAFPLLACGPHGRLFWCVGVLSRPNMEGFACNENSTTHSHPSNPRACLCVPQLRCFGLFSSLAQDDPAPVSCKSSCFRATNTSKTRCKHWLCSPILSNRCFPGCACQRLREKRCLFGVWPPTCPMWEGSAHLDVDS